MHPTVTANRSAKMKPTQSRGRQLRSCGGTVSIATLVLLASIFYSILPRVYFCMICMETIKQEPLNNNNKKDQHLRHQWSVHPSIQPSICPCIIISDRQFRTKRFGYASEFCHVNTPVVHLLLPNECNVVLCPFF